MSPAPKRFNFNISSFILRFVFAIAHSVSLCSHHCGVTQLSGYPAPLATPPPLPAGWYCLSFSYLPGAAFSRCLGWTLCSSGTLPSFTFLRVRTFPHLFAACTVVFYSLGCEGHLGCLCVLVVMKKAACPFLGIFCVVVFSVPLTESRNIMAELCPHCCGTMIWYSVKICYLYFNKI